MRRHSRPALTYCWNSRRAATRGKVRATARDQGIIRRGVHHVDAVMCSGMRDRSSLDRDRVVTKDAQEVGLFRLGDDCLDRAGISRVAATRRRIVNSHGYAVASVSEAIDARVGLGGGSYVASADYCERPGNRRSIGRGLYLPLFRP